MAELTHFTREGLRFDVRDGGPADGPVVILLHGFPQDSTSWDRVAPLLHAQGLRTLAPDQRGYSPGARPSAVSSYAQPELVADVLALADAAGAHRFHLVGHDWGGAIVWNTAIAEPQRVSSLTVLSTPHPSALGRALRTPGQLGRSWYIGAFQVPKLPELVFAGRAGSLLRRSGVPDEAAQHYDERFATPQDMRGPINWYRATVRSSGLTRGSNAAAFVRVPTTFVWGNRDFALGRTAAEHTADYVAAPYRFVELDASHWLPEREPEAVASAVVERVSGDDAAG